MAYTLFYMFASWQSELPWTHCDPEWANTGEIGPQCFVRNSSSTLTPCKEVAEAYNMTLLEIDANDYNCTKPCADIAKELGNDTADINPNIYNCSKTCGEIATELGISLATMNSTFYNCTNIQTPAEQYYE